MKRRPNSLRIRLVLTPRGMGTLAAAFALCGYAVTPSTSANRAQIVWNITASAPIGLYRVRRGRELVRGDLVLAVPGTSLAEFAAGRGYVPLGTPLVKRIAAIAGDTVCAGERDVFIDGRLVATRFSADSKGRPLPTWFGCRTLGPDQVFLLMEGVRSSFDGRYFGPTRISQIAGRLDPIWTR